MIPKIYKYFINDKTENIIKNYLVDDGYFITPNSFQLISVKIGPFPKALKLKLNFASLIHKDIKFINSKVTLNADSFDKHYYIIDFNSEMPINFDLSIKAKASGVAFYSWVNLWYSTLNRLSSYITLNNLHLDHHEREIQMKHKQLQHSSTSFFEMKSHLYDEPDLDELENKDKNRASSVNKRERSKSGNFKLMELIEEFDRTKDLNSFINGVNKLARSFNVMAFDKKNINLNVSISELDKVKNVKKMDKNLSMMLNYKIK